MTRAAGHARRLSLRRQWIRAFVVLFLLVVAATSTAAYYERRSVGQFRATADLLAASATAAAELRADVNSQVAAVHELLDGTPALATAFLRTQHSTMEHFRRALARFTEPAQHAALIQAYDQYIATMRSGGYWAAAPVAAHQSPPSMHWGLAVMGSRSLASLDRFDAESRVAADHRLAQAEAIQRTSGYVFVGVLLVALGALVGYAFRLSRDVLRPVAVLDEAVGRLRAGDVAHRIEVAAKTRNNELTDLAGAFNAMAAVMHESRDDLTYQAKHDSLTGLGNRAAFSDHLRSTLAGGRDRPARLSVLFVDVDDFKTVNDTLGHAGGDALLTELAVRLRAVVRPSDFVARLGGDEFAIAVVDADAAGKSAALVAQRLVEAAARPFVIGGREIAISVSVGISGCDPDAGDTDDLIGQADFAMYTAKGSGKARYEVFDERILETTRSRTTLRADLETAVDNDELRLEYQPVFDLVSRGIVGVEALVRWQHPTRGRLAPAEFLDLAEQSGRIDEIGRWVVETAVHDLAAWHSLPGGSDLWLAVNVSPVELRDDSIPSVLHNALAAYDISPAYVVLDITEGGLAGLGTDGMARLEALRRTGIRVALDDFGTGPSSLSALQELPVDVLKIDRSFVAAHAARGRTGSMLDAIVQLGRGLGLTVIAEGVEDAAHIRALAEVACDLGQGYGLGGPARAEAFVRLLHDNVARPVG